MPRPLPSTPLSPVDTAWLQMEDPTNLMMVTGIFRLARPLSAERLERVLQRRMVDRFPRLRCKVRRRGLAAWWVADRHFSIGNHVHRMALPSPGGEAALREVVADLLATPLDFSKPLWQCHLIEGVDGGCVVLVRIHHCIGDGVALVHVVLSLTDATPDPPAEPRFQRTHAFERDPRSRIESFLDGAVGTARGAAAGAVRATRALAGALAQGDLSSLLEASRVRQLAQGAAAGASALLKLVLRGADPLTPLKGPLGVAKRAAWSQPIPLAEVKATARAVGGTVNDVLVAALAGALRRYLEGRSAAVEGLEVNAVCPVNLRPLHEAEQLGNRFGLIWLALPIGSADPLERLRLVKERMDALKRSPEPLVVFGILSALGVAPAEVSGPLVDLFGAKGTAVLTNVAGPRQAIYIAGGRIEDIMFWVPQSGRLGLGLSILSYDGRVRVGVASDRGLVPDPEAIADAFEAEFAALAEAARQAQPAGTPAPARPRRAPARPRKAAGPRKAASRPRPAAADRTGKRRKRA